MTMKVLCGFLLFVCVCEGTPKFDESLLSDDVRKLRDSLHSTCIEKIGVSEDIIKAAADGELKDDHSLKCYAKCVMSEGGVLSEKGEFDLAPLKEMLPEKVRDDKIRTIENCLPKANGIEDLCEKAFALVKCEAETDPDNFYFF